MMAITRLHSFKTEKAASFIVTAVKTSNLTHTHTSPEDTKEDSGPLRRDRFHMEVEKTT
jgi:hypothetical protein